MPIEDEPVLRRNVGSNNDPGEPLVDRIRRLVTTQPYGVLCTHGDGLAYGSLVAFAFTEDLRFAIFATPVATRKYRLLSEEPQVALVVDDRPRHPGEMMKVEAVTATGRAEEIPAGPLLESHARLLLARHPQLQSFVAARSSALFRIKINRFFHVSRFQEVNQWVPIDPS
jgi:nitroimidazol reductase NimA-like FMN-containing flavoprotein (pyridoxamine 5'-phosphate oxidase superfamily)